MSIRQVDKRTDHIRTRSHVQAQAHTRPHTSFSSNHSNGHSNSNSNAGNPFGSSAERRYSASVSTSPSKRRRLESLHDRLANRAVRLLLRAIALIRQPRILLYALGSVLGLYLFLQLNEALNPPKLSAHVPVPSGTKDLRIKKAQKEKDVLDRRKEIFRHPTTGEIKRDVAEPDYALLSGKQPHEIGCDVPLIGETMEREEIGRLVLVGVFTTPESYERREL